jgi:hypothetical protein
MVSKCEFPTFNRILKEILRKILRDKLIHGIIAVCTLLILVIIHRANVILYSKYLNYYITFKNTSGMTIKLQNNIMKIKIKITILFYV